eukprot:11852174-Karenia_brevis.AAC.1
MPAGATSPVLFDRNVDAQCEPSDMAFMPAGATPVLFGCDSTEVASSSLKDFNSQEVSSAS